MKLDVGLRTSAAIIFAKIKIPGVIGVESERQSDE
jgi:hypothetical protein